MTTRLQTQNAFLGRVDVAAMGLSEDLLTDWIPDPVDCLGLELVGLSAPPEDFNGRLSVATSSGARSVPVASLEFRAWAHSEVNKTLTGDEALLPGNVFGYRDALTPYRDEWSRLRKEAARLSDGYTLIRRADVRTLFQSLDADVLQGLVPSGALEVAATSQRIYGLALLPGHRWARRIANIALSVIDRRIRVPFLRWQDDYWLYCADEREADDVMAELTDELQSHRLELNADKSQMQSTPWVEFPAPEVLALMDVPALLEEAMGAGDVSLIKYLLRWLHATGTPRALPVLPELVSRYPVTAPRVAMYLARCLDETEARRALSELLDVEDLWLRSRFTAVALQREEVAKAIPSDVIAHLANSGIPAAQGLAARAQMAQGRAVVFASSRINHVLRILSEGSLAEHPPPLETTL